MISAVILLSVSCCISNGLCSPWNPIFGTCTQECYSCETGANSASGILEWIPFGMNYVESPWALRKDNRLWIGGHAGLCCNDYSDDEFWAIVWWGNYPQSPAYFRSRVLPDARQSDDHEVGGWSPLYLGGRWFFIGARTERSYWGQGNRLRPFILETSDPVFGDIFPDREPLFYPEQPECREMGNVHPICEESIGAAQHGSILTTKDGRVLMLSKDDVGLMNPIAYSNSGYVVHIVDPVLHIASFLYQADFGNNSDGRKFYPSISDWALGADGLVYAYGGNTPGSNWYNSTAIIEWVSEDEGRTWERTGRNWKAPAGNALWDAGVMRQSGGWIAEPLTIVAVTAPLGSWATEGKWRIWWWTANRDLMPSGLVGPRKPRRRLSME